MYERGKFVYWIEIEDAMLKMLGHITEVNNNYSCCRKPCMHAVLGHAEAYLANHYRTQQKL